MSLEDRRNNAKAAFEAARARLRENAQDRTKSTAETLKAPKPPTLDHRPKGQMARDGREAEIAASVRAKTTDLKKDSILDEIGKKRSGLTEQRIKDDFDRSR